MDDRQRLRVVLKQLIERSKGHREDYHRWVEASQKAGMKDVAALIEEAQSHLVPMESTLGKALDLID